MNRAEAGLIGAKRAAETNRNNKLKRIENYNKNPNLCCRCKQSLKYEKRKNKFCSHSCAQSFNNIGIRRHGIQKNKCLNCENIVGRNSTKYCSHKCRVEYIWKQWCLEVETLGFFEGYTASDSGGPASKPKRYILQKQNNKCSICGIDSWQGKPVPFVLDHINGDSTNWRIENMRVVCRNCDGQLDTYCGRNRGKGKRLYSISRDDDGNVTKSQLKNY